MQVVYYDTLNIKSILNLLGLCLNVEESKDDWGTSVREFDTNRDHPGTNRFELEWNSQESNYFSPLHLFDGAMRIVTLDDDLMSLNDFMSDMTHTKIYDLLMEFNNKNITANDIWKMPTYNLAECANRCAFAVCWENKIYGWICVQFDSNEIAQIQDEIQYHLCDIIGGGVYYQPVNIIGKCDVEKTDPNQIANSPCNIQTLHPLPFEILSQSKVPLGFMRELQHQIGYVCIPLHTLWGADWKGLFSMIGHKGASATYRCAWCDSSTKDQFQTPTPDNRKWKSNDNRVIQQAAVSANTNCNQNLQLSFKKFPILPCGFDRFCLPTLHTNLGPIHKIFTVIRDKIQNATKTNTTIEQYNEKYSDMHQIENDISNYKHSLRFLQDLENTEQFDSDFTESLDDHQQSLKAQLHNLNGQLKQLQSEFAKIEIELQSNDGCLQLLNIYDKMKIKPWQVKKGSMVGLAGKNFLKHQDILLAKLKQCDEKCYDIAYPMCKRLEFWCNVTWSKHLILFDDALLQTLEWNLHEFQYLYHKFISNYGGGKGKKFGIKIHGFYHILEFVKWKRWSTAEIDDERIEAWNAYISKYAPIFHCFGGAENLSKMINKIWRDFVMQWNPNNCNVFWNGKKYV